MNRFTFLLFLSTFLFIFGSATEAAQPSIRTPTPGNAAAVTNIRTLLYLDLTNATDLFGIRTLAGFKRFLLNQSILFRIASEGAYYPQWRNKNAAYKLQVDNALKLLESTEPADEGEIVDISGKNLEEKEEYVRKLQRLLASRPNYRIDDSPHWTERQTMLSLGWHLSDARKVNFTNSDDAVYRSEPAVPTPGNAAAVTNIRTLSYLTLEKATDLFGIRTLAGFKRFLLNQSILFKIASEGAYSPERRNERASDKIQVDDALKLLTSTEPADEGEIVDISGKSLAEKEEYVRMLQRLHARHPNYRMDEGPHFYVRNDMIMLGEDLRNVRTENFVNSDE